MTPEDIKGFVARHAGKRISLYNDWTGGTITGTIVGVHERHLAVSVQRDDGSAQVLGLPRRPVLPKWEGRTVVFESIEKSLGRKIRYRLTIQT